MENIEKNASFYPKEHVDLLKANPKHYEKYKDELEEEERKKAEWKLRLCHILTFFSYVQTRPAECIGRF